MSVTLPACLCSCGRHSRPSTCSSWTCPTTPWRRVTWASSASRCWTTSTRTYRSHEEFTQSFILIYSHGTGRQQVLIKYLTSSYLRCFQDSLWFKEQTGVKLCFCAAGFPETRGPKWASSPSTAPSTSTTCRRGFPSRRCSSSPTSKVSRVGANCWTATAFLLLLKF